MLNFMIDYFDTCNYNCNILMATFNIIEPYIKHQYLLLMNVDASVNN